MSRDPSKLRVFALADELVAEVYRATSAFPRAEQFGLQAQIRRAAVSVAGNIVEGSARRTTGEYVNSLNVAAGSAAETRYLVELAGRLGLVGESISTPLVSRYTELLKGILRLIHSLEDLGR